MLSLNNRDTLEQIDVSKLLIEKYPDVSIRPPVVPDDRSQSPLTGPTKTFRLALGTRDIKSAIEDGKIASLIGVEGYVDKFNRLSFIGSSSVAGRYWQYTFKATRLPTLVN